MSCDYRMTLIQMLRQQAELRPAVSSILCGDRRVSFLELWQCVRVLSSFLIRSGLARGQRVGIMMEKRPEAIISFLGVVAAGGVVVPINPHANAASVDEMLTFGNCAFLITEGKFQGLLAALIFSIPDTNVIMVDVEGRVPYVDWNTVMEKRDVKEAVVDAGADDPVYLNFTSGSIGKPKAVLVTHAHIYWNTVASVEALGLLPEDVHLCMFPGYMHPHEMFARPLYLGGTMVLSESHLPRALAVCIERHRVTCMMAVASIYALLVPFAQLHTFDATTLRLAESGGMRVNEALSEDFYRVFGFPITPVWGSTETTGVALACPVSKRVKSGEIGVPCPHYEVSVVDDRGIAVANGQVGEMIIRGPAVSMSYLSESLTETPCANTGWLHTGDLVKQGKDGMFCYVGRRDDMLKVGGMQVFTKEIEDVISNHSAVEEVAVVGVEDASRGYVMRAFVVSVKGALVNPIDIRQYCAERLASYKVPRIIEFVSDLPRTASGKVRYGALRTTAISGRDILNENSSSCCAG